MPSLVNEVPTSRAWEAPTRQRIAASLYLSLLTLFPALQRPQQRLVAGGSLTPSDTIPPFLIIEVRRPCPRAGAYTKAETSKMDSRLLALPNEVQHLVVERVSIRLPIVQG